MHVIVTVFRWSTLYWSWVYFTRTTSSLAWFLHVVCLYVWDKNSHVYYYNLHARYYPL